MIEADESYSKQLPLRPYHRQVSKKLAIELGVGVNMNSEQSQLKSHAVGTSETGRKQIAAQHCKVMCRVVLVLMNDLVNACCRNPVPRPEDL